MLFCIVLYWFKFNFKLKIISRPNVWAGHKHFWFFELDIVRTVVLTSPSSVRSIDSYLVLPLFLVGRDNGSTQYF